MSSIGSFGTFTTARLGIYASQKGLSVTGNNIANINTKGYTRQRLDQVSLKTGGADRYQSSLDVHVGNGVLCAGVSQLRDPYLDIRYRTEMASVGYTNTRLGGLNDIASILDEVGKGTGKNEDDGLLYAQFSDFLTSLNNLNTEAGTESNDSLARASADQIVSLFNTYADKLEKLHSDAEVQLKQDIQDVNKILESIRELNVAIRKSNIHGDEALEMRDDRNLLIDQLSEYMKIDVTYSMEDLGAGQQVEKLTIKLANANPDPTVTTDSAMLVDGIYATQLACPKKNDAYDPIYDSRSEEYAAALQDLADGKTVTLTNPDGTTTDYTDADAFRQAVKDADVSLKYRYLDENGEATDDPLDALFEFDDNYNITLSKLLDKNGKEWEQITKPLTTGPIPAPAGAPVKAVYSYELNVNDWGTDPKKLTIAGRDYIVPDYIADDEAQLANYVATRLAKYGGYDDYTVAADGNRIVFTAKTAGAIAGDGPAAVPNLTLGNAAGKLTLGPRSEDSVGQDLTPPFAYATTTDDEKGTKNTLTYYQLGTDWYQNVTMTRYTQETHLDDNDLYGSLQATRELLTEQGEFALTDTVNNVDENAAIKRGIPYYQLSLDLLAKKFADTFNETNNGFAMDQKGNYLTEDGQTIELAGEPVNKTNGLTDAQKRALIDDGCVVMEEDGVTPAVDENGDQIPDLERFLDAKGAERMGGNLFSNSGDSDDCSGITASNISISHSWSAGDVHIVSKYTRLFGGEVEDTTQNSNIAHMISLMGKNLVYNPQDLVEGAVSSHLFEGSFHGMMDKMCGVLGNDQRITGTMLDTYSGHALELDTSRDSVSAVDLNDEAMNLMQYTHSLNAAYRLMTTIDEALERLINNTGIVGR